MEPPPPEAGEDGDSEKDPFGLFRSWHGFFAATVAVNLLFVITLLGHNDPSVALWHKILLWLPFTAVVSAVYLAVMSRLPSLLYRLACPLLIGLNWALLLFA